MTRFAAWLALVVMLIASTATPRDADRLLFHAEAEDGAVLLSRGADTEFNPASVVKVGTSLLALEKLGAGYRYTTVFGTRGEWDRATGVLDGDLVVAAGGDPDLQAENLMLVALELEALGLRRVTGAVVVRGPLWVGWENGVEKRVVETAARAPVAGARLRDAFDAARWSSSLRSSWDALARRRGLDVVRPPRLKVEGGVRFEAEATSEPLVEHRSAPLPELLKRFNVYSNNDIVRFADGLGGVETLQALLVERLAQPVELSTASGERRNRMTARGAVRLVWELDATAAWHGFTVRRVLPVLGCDPGPTRRMFPRFQRPPLSAAVAVKTGTLTTTDGGVVVLAGHFVSPTVGEVVFCVAAPQAGGAIDHWRRLQQEWLVDLIGSVGGVVASPCAGELPFSDSLAEIRVVGEELPSEAAPL